MMGIAEEDACEATAREAASLPLALGGLGLRSAQRTHPSAYWAGWADSLHMVQKRHPGVVAHLLTHLEGVPVAQSLTSASPAARSLAGVHGFDIPAWRSLAAGVHPPPRDPEDHEPGSPRQGWQHEASSRVEQQFRALDLFPRLTDTEKTMLRSQSGPGAGAFLSTTPSNLLTRIDSFSFRTLLCRGLRLAIPLSTRICWCGRTIDHFGHHSAACARSGVLARRGFAVESAVARTCREGGGRVATNRMIRDLDLAVPNPGDLRSIEVIVDGLGIFGGAHLAVDATMVSPVRADGLSRTGAAARDGVALTTARLRKQRTFPELSGRHRRCRLVVFATETGGRWSSETRGFLRALARFRARSEPPLLRKRVEQAWRMRWWSVLRMVTSLHRMKWRLSRLSRVSCDCSSVFSVC